MHNDRLHTQLKIVIEKSFFPNSAKVRDPWDGTGLAIQYLPVRVLTLHRHFFHSMADEKMADEIQRTS